MKIKVVIIEDHPAFRESLKSVINTSEGFICSGAYNSVEEALPAMPKPDVVLLDIHLPGISGIEAIPKIKAQYPYTHIVMVTVFDDDQNIFRAIVAGADGYLLKKTPMVRILQSIEDAAAGGVPMTPIIAKQALALFRSHIPASNSKTDLTEREVEILRFLVDGLGTDEIAEKIFVTRKTVGNHITHIYEKLHVHSKSQAVVKAIREGIV